MAELEPKTKVLVLDDSCNSFRRAIDYAVIDSLTKPIYIWNLSKDIHKSFFVSYLHCY